MTAPKQKPIGLPPEQEARARAIELSIHMGVAGIRLPLLLQRAHDFTKFILNGSIPSDSEITPRPPM